MSRFFTIFFIAMWVIACGPEPGTPEYVLQEIRQGKVVGGKNLQLLNAPELSKMLEIINDPQSPRMARLQLVERATRMKLDDPYSKLASLIQHKDPEVRIAIASWLGSRSEQAVTINLIDALKKETVLAVETNLVNALIRQGTEIPEPPQATVDRLVLELQNAPAPRKKLWARVISGWRGEKIITALSTLLGSKDTELAVIAATAIVGPLQRPIDVLIPIAKGMLNHQESRVRAAGLGGLLASTFPGRVSGLAACSETQVKEILSHSPELPQTVTEHLARTDIKENEKKIGKQLLECLEKYSAKDSAESDSTKEES